VGALLGGVVALAGACKDLSSFTLGVCGNSVLEAGEDCEPGDQSSDPQKVGYCAPKGDPDECHFVCRNGLGCPGNEHCGIDGVCRAAGSTFVSAGAPVAAKADAIHLGDFDGDGRADLLVSKSDSFDLYFSAGRELGAPATLPADPREGVAVGFLNHDVTASGATTVKRELADIIVGSGAALGALLGDPGRQLSVAAVSSYTFDSDTRILAGPSKAVSQPTPALKDDTQVEGLLNGDNPFVMILKSPTGQLSILNGPGGLPFPFKPSDISPRTQLAALVEGRPSRCEEIVLSAEAAGVAFVTYACKTDAGVVVPNTPPLDPPTVQIKSGGMPLTGPAIVADVVDLANAKLGADGHLDIVLPVAGGLRVAPGDGTKAYPNLVGTTVTATDLCGFAGSGALCQVLGDDVLALADLNGDGRIDVVQRNGVALSDASGYYQGAYPSLKPWGEAVVADFNGDGRLDVAATPQQDRKGLEILLTSDGSYLNPTVLPASAPLGLLTTGDYDGDGITDVVARAHDRASEKCETVDDIVAFFGRASGGVEQGRVVGRLRGVQQIVSGRLPRLDKTDSITDLGVESECLTLETTRRVSVFYGTGDRLLDAPFLLTDQVGPESKPEILPYEPVAIALPSGKLGASPAASVTIATLGTFQGGTTPASAFEAAELFIETSDQSSLFQKGHVLHVGSGLTPALAARSALATGDLDGDPGAEVALWIPAADGEAASHLLVFDDYDCVPDHTGENTGACAPKLTSIDLPAVKAGEVGKPQILLGDLDGDGIDDLVVHLPRDTGGRLFYVRSSGGLGATPPVEVSDLAASGVAFLSPDPASTKGEGRVLLASGISPSAGAGVFSLSFSGAQPVEKELDGVVYGGGGLGGLATGDVDGDGLDDIAVLDNGAVSLYFRGTALAGDLAKKGGSK
jgi:hypothetical protein